MLDMRTVTILSFLLLALAGCGGASYQVVPVSGKVTLNGKPLAKAHVTFAPIGGLDKETGSPAHGQTDEGQCRDQQRRNGRIAPAPAPEPLSRAHGPGLDRPTLAESPEIIGQCHGAGVAPMRLLGQALQADRLQVARHLRG